MVRPQNSLQLALFKLHTAFDTVWWLQGQGILGENGVKKLLERVKNDFSRDLYVALDAPTANYFDRSVKLNIQSGQVVLFLSTLDFPSVFEKFTEQLGDEVFGPAPFLRADPRNKTLSIDLNAFSTMFGITGPG